MEGTKAAKTKLMEGKRSESIPARMRTVENRSSGYKPGTLKPGQTKPPKPTTLDIPHKRHMKKQVSFDYRSPSAGEIPEDCSSISKEGLSFIEKMSDTSLTENQPIRSYQRDLLEYAAIHKDESQCRGSVLDVPIVATLEVIPPKPGNNRLSRKDKQTGWSLPDPNRSSSKTARAVERFLVNLTRPTDQRNQPIPRKPPKTCDPVPSKGGPGPSNKGGKMKVEYQKCF